MDVATELQSLRNTLPACELAMFVDLSSKMALSVDTDRDPDQEELDAISRAAEIGLAGPIADDAMPIVAGEGGASVVVSLTAGEARLYLRSRTLPTEALVLVCEAGINIGTATDRARETLERIVSAGA